MNQPEELERLQAEHQEMRGNLKQALAELSQGKEAQRLARAGREEREKQRKLPECVKENVKKRPAAEKKRRKKWDATHHRGRERGRPTQFVEYRVVTCPQCHLQLRGISMARMRDVIKRSEPRPVEIIYHRIFTGWGTQRGPGRVA